MAGDWIKMRGNLWDDPRVAAICDATGSTEGPVIGALYWLWATADQHTEDGCMPGLTLGQIDRKTGLRGFAAALVAIGWLADDPQGVVILNFEEHNGASAKKRASTAKRVANHRAGNADETPNDESCNAASVTGALAREEKRREDKRQTPPPPSGEGGAFAFFWQAWPEHRRKVARDQCERRWRRMGLDNIAPRVMAGLSAHVSSAHWAKDDGEYVPAPLLWLKECRWTAELEPTAGVKAAARVDETAAYLAQQEAHGKAIDSPETRALAAAALASLGVRRVASG